MPMTHEDARYHRDVELTVANHVYRGRSIGSQATCHQFPGHDVAFDIGQATLSSTVIPHIFVTHGHDDHIGGLGSHHLRRDGWGLDPACYYVQEEDVPLVRDMVRVQAILNRSKALQHVDVVPVGEGSAIPVGKSGLVVKPFRTTHRIPCLGYSLWGTRKRLRPEYRGASRDVLVAAKSRGEDINEVFEVCEVAFPGDTNLNILNRSGGDVVRAARLLLLECTFIDDEVSPKETARTGHIHLDDFIAAARDGVFNQNEVILLTHFSARYHPNYIREVVTKKLAGEAVGQKVKLCIP